MARVVAFSLCALAASRACDPVSDDVVQWETYETSIGPSRHITLDDGGSVDLNTSSRLQILTTNTRRMMILDRGEAYFRSGSKTSQLHAGDLFISADNSSFSVRSRGRNVVEVMALDGQIHVNPAPRGAVGLLRISHQVQVGAPRSQVATLRAGAISLYDVDTASLHRKLMWRYGMLEFVNASIEEIAEEFNRYSRTRLVVDDASVSKLRLGGRFSEYDLESFIATACKVFALHPQMRNTAAGPTVRLRLGRTSLDAQEPIK